MVPGGVELGVLAANTVLGGILKIWAVNSQEKSSSARRQIELAAVKGDLVGQARDYGLKADKGWSWTRRTISIFCTFMIIGWPLIVPVFWPDVPVAVSYSTVDLGSLWRSGGGETVQWVVAEGLAVTPLHTMVMMSLLGLFFGSEIAKPVR